jgi:hypothetical protein
VAKQTSKGTRHQRRASAIERKATRHHDFIGDADAERAESEHQKHERLQAKEDREVVRQMASELDQAAGGDGAVGPEFPLRIPHSLEEAKEIVREAPDALRDKARERLGNLSEPAQKALHVAEAAITLLFVPVRLGLSIALQIARLPLSILRGMRHREA